MKAIKKVEVVPLDVNYGKIIDSFSTTDVKTANAPSINAVENYVDTAISTKANSSDVYTKTETDNLLASKANSSDVYTKTETDNLLSSKANSSDVYSKSATVTLLDNYVLKSYFSIVTFEFTDTGISTASYPSGWDQSHSYIVSIMYENRTFIGDGQGGIQVALGSSQITCTNTRAAGTVDVVLMYINENVG